MFGRYVASYYQYQAYYSTNGPRTETQYVWRNVDQWHLQLTLSDAEGRGERQKTPLTQWYFACLRKIKGKYFTYFILLFLVMSLESLESLFCPYSISCGREFGKSEILGYMNKFWGQRCKVKQMRIYALDSVNKNNLHNLLRWERTPLKSKLSTLSRKISRVLKITFDSRLRQPCQKWRTLQTQSIKPQLSWQQDTAHWKNAIRGERHFLFIFAIVSKRGPSVTKQGSMHHKVTGGLSIF